MSPGDGWGDGCATMWMCVTPLSVHSKMLKMLHFMSYVFFIINKLHTKDHRHQVMISHWTKSDTGSMDEVPHYHKLCGWVSCIWRNRRGQHTWSAVGEPHSGKTIFMIIVSPLPGKYIVCPLSQFKKYTHIYIYLYHPYLSISSISVINICIICIYIYIYIIYL